MSLENKLALLKKYVPQDYYKLGHFIDACDSTEAFCFARIIQINHDQGNLLVNFDGWSNKWDLVSHIQSLTLALVVSIQIEQDCALPFAARRLLRLDQDSLAKPHEI